MEELAKTFFEDSFSHLHEFQQNQILCDVKLRGKSNGYTIHAHKIILASKSLYFKAMFTSDMKESREDLVTLESFESNILEKIISYCYTGEIVLLPCEIEEILDASHMLGVDHIQEKCFMFLRNNIDITNCYGIAFLAEKYSCKEISKIAENYAVKNFRLIANTDDFLNLSYDNLSNLVSNNELNVLCEAEVYDAILKWAKYNIASRKKLLKRLLSYVRFPLLTRKFLIDIVTKEELIINDSECREYLYNALDYHLVPERRSLVDQRTFSPRITMTTALYVVGGESE